MVDGDADDSGVPTLAQLITEQKDLYGYSYAELAARTDHVISRQRWQQLGTGVRLHEFPEPATLAAISAALGVNVSHVLLATARTIGLPVEIDGTSDLARMMPYSARKLTVDQRNAILAVVRSIVDPDRAERLADARAVARGEKPIMPPGHGSTPESPKPRQRRRGV